VARSITAADVGVYLAAGGTEIVTIKYSLVAIQRLGNGDILLQAQVVIDRINVEGILGFC